MQVAFSEKNLIFSARSQNKFRTSKNRVLIPKRQWSLPFWYYQMAKKQSRLPFQRKIIFIQLQIKINSDMTKIELWFKKRRCMLPFWCDYVAKRYFRLLFPTKIIFFLLQIKIISDTVYKKQSFGSKRQCMLPFWCDYVAKGQ